MDGSLPGSSVHGICQARILAWGAISFSRGSSGPGIEPGSPALPAFCSSGAAFLGSTHALLPTCDLSRVSDGACKPAFTPLYCRLSCSTCLVGLEEGLNKMI